MDSVILASPILLALYGAALLLCIADIITHVFGHVLQIAAAVLFVSATAYALLLGANLAETGIAALIFLGVDLVSYIRHGGGK